MGQRENPFQWLHDECNSGPASRKYEELPPFPRMIDIELTNTCDFRCRMCPTGNRAMKRPVGFMAWETFEKIVDQCGPEGTALRFIGWGEPLMHPAFHRFLRYAKEALLLVHLNTNGSKMNDWMAGMLIKGHLDSIKFSFQGVDRQSYHDMRKTDFFEELFHKIRRMHMKRGDKGRPFMAVSTTITDETPEMVDRFRRRFGGVCDQVSVGRTVTGYYGGEPDEGLEHLDPCPEVYDKLSISWDGSVRLCCHDFNGTTNLGNVNAMTIETIWHDQLLHDYRVYLMAKIYDQAPCYDCWDYLTEKGD